MTELQIYRITDLQNYRTELQKDRQGKSSIAPLFQSGAIITQKSSYYLVYCQILMGTELCT